MIDEARYCQSCKISLEPRSLKCRYCRAILEYSSTDKQLRIAGYACRKCGSINLKNEAFCGTCGAKLSGRCPWCHNTINFGVILCPVCKRNIMKRKLAEETRGTIENLQSQINRAQHEKEVLLRPFKGQIAKGNAVIDDLKKELEKCQIRFPLIPFVLLLLLYSIIVFVIFQEIKSALVYIVGYGVFMIAVVIFELYRSKLGRRAPVLSRGIKKKQQALNEIILQQQKTEEKSEQNKIIRSMERTLEETKHRLKQNLDRMD